MVLLVVTATPVMELVGARFTVGGYINHAACFRLTFLFTQRRNFCGGETKNSRKNGQWWCVGLKVRRRSFMFGG
jgi:hypothetical protein